MSIINIRSLENSPKVPFKFDGKILYSSEKLELIHLSLPADGKMEPHTQPFDVVFYVLSGEGNLNADGKNFEGKPGTCIHVPAGVHRSWSNSGDENFRVLVIKDLK